MTCHPSNAAQRAFRDADQRWPNRSHATDGTCPSAAHSAANPRSDHEPDPRLGFVSCAFDLTHDPAHGLDAPQVGDELRRHWDHRVKYLIRHNAQLGHDEIAMWSDPRWRDANQNQHASHLHVSLIHTAAVVNDVSRWFAAPVTPTPAPDPDEDEMAAMLYPNQALRTGPYRGKTPTFMVDRMGNARFLTREDVALNIGLGMEPPKPFPRAQVEGFHLLSRMDGL